MAQKLKAAQAQKKGTDQRNLNALDQDCQYGHGNVDVLFNLFGRKQTGDAGWVQGFRDTLRQAERRLSGSAMDTKMARN